MSLLLWQRSCLLLPPAPLPPSSYCHSLVATSRGTKHNVGIPKHRTVHVSCFTHVLGVAEGPWGSPARGAASCCPVVSVVYGTDVVSGSWFSSTGPWENSWSGRDQRWEPSTQIYMERLKHEYSFRWKEGQSCGNLEDHLILLFSFICKYCGPWRTYFSSAMRGVGHIVGNGNSLWDIVERFWAMADKEIPLGQ